LITGPAKHIISALKAANERRGLLIRARLTGCTFPLKNALALAFGVFGDLQNNLIMIA
jgi:hypothetical protein